MNYQERQHVKNNLTLAYRLPARRKILFMTPFYILLDREHAQSSPILLCSSSSIGHSLLLFVMSPFGHQMDMISLVWLRVCCTGQAELQGISLIMKRKAFIRITTANLFVDSFPININATQQQHPLYITQAVDVQQLEKWLQLPSFNFQVQMDQACSLSRRI